jgi:dimethylaniline monooxygenase (N-oxide forming)
MFWGIPNPIPIPEMDLIDKIRNGDGVEVYRADITRLEGKTIYLSDETEIETDILIHATGYSAQEMIFSLQDAYELSLPVPFADLPTLEKESGFYAQRSKEMDEEVLRRFPRLAQSPSKNNNPTYTQHRLYQSILPLSLLEKQDRSLAFVGYLQGTGISVIADVSSLWAVAWLSGQMDLRRDVKEIEWEVDYLNAFTRNRHGKKGAETPVALFEWISVREVILGVHGQTLTPRDRQQML